MFKKYYYEDEFIIESTRTIKRSSKEMDESLKEILKNDLIICNNINNDAKKILCKQQAYYKLINTMNVLKLTCKTSRCFNATNNKLNNYIQKYRNLGGSNL